MPVEATARRQLRWSRKLVRESGAYLLQVRAIEALADAEEDGRVRHALLVEAKQLYQDGEAGEAELGYALHG
ncbi:hypothetical protein [Streptomyces sp. NPDC007083]|uniref:hypothetical protein n=1 Tax=Streptomyces sp. NPDC007083 TaxID=3156913 RepID=UPI0033D3B24F